MKKKVKKKSGKATLAAVKKEMAKPRMSKSARKDYLSVHAVRGAKMPERFAQASAPIPVIRRGA
jgi:hypothetical protein